MKLTIVMAYYNRQNLLDATMRSLEMSSVKDYELIIVDDASVKPLKCDRANIIYVDKKDKWYTCSAVAFNQGFREAIGDIIIIQNPECYHAGDVMRYVLENIRPNDYLSFGCYSINNSETQKLYDGVMPRIGDYMTTTKTGNGWYNHTRHRPVGYHFCSAITRKDLEMIGGFDERYALGSAFDDDDFIRCIRNRGMNVKIINDPFVIHQHHTHFEMDNASTWVPLHNRNQNLFHMGYDSNTPRDYSRNTEFFPSSDPPWDVIKSSYDNNFLNYFGDKTDRIPKKLHVMWLGGELPQHCIDLLDEWIAMHPTWDFKIWTKQDLGYFAPESFIYQILYKHGGVCIDVNFKCVKPLDDLLYLDFFGGGRRGVNEPQRPLLMNRIMGAAPQNELVRLLMEGREERSSEYPINKYLKYITESEDRVVLFPDAFFYPMSDCFEGEITKYDDAVKSRINSYIKPQTYCIYLSNYGAYKEKPPTSTQSDEPMGAPINERHAIRGRRRLQEERRLKRAERRAERRIKRKGN